MRISEEILKKFTRNKNKKPNLGRKSFGNHVKHYPVLRKVPVRSSSSKGKHPALDELSPVPEITVTETKEQNTL